MTRLRPAHAQRPLQFRAAVSPLHGLGAGWKLVAAMGIGALGLGIASPSRLLLALLAVALGYPLAG